MRRAAREGLLVGHISVIVVSAVAVVSLGFAIGYKRSIGPVLLLLGALSLTPIKLTGRTIKSCAADLVFGMIDTSFLAIAALIGAHFFQVLGAIVGAVAGDAITDGFAGLWEGRVAQYLRAHGIREARTSLSASMGKMAGCFIGVGIVLTLVWTLMGL